MKRDELDPLSPEVQRLLAHEREIAPAPTELRARVMVRAHNALQVSVLAATRVSRRMRPLLIAAALVITVAAVSFAAWLGQRSDGSDQALAMSPADEPKVRAASAAKAPPAPTQAQPPQREVTEAVEKEEAQPGEKEPAARSPRRSPADLDALELALLQRARAAVARRDFASALEALLEHQRRFPKGKFQEEREAMRVKALAGLGRDDEARRAAQRFRDRFPDSVLSPRIEGINGAP
jgi:type IV secretory pathway VirB10-like protein